MKLVSVGKGLSTYETEDHLYRVTKHEGLTLMGSRSHRYTRWLALSVTEKRPDGYPLRVAESDSLSGLRTRLGAYLRDKAAGTVQRLSMYGVHGDRVLP